MSQSDDYYRSLLTWGQDFVLAIPEVMFLAAVPAMFFKFTVCALVFKFLAVITSNFNSLLYEVRRSGRKDGQ